MKRQMNALKQKIKDFFGLPLCVILNEQKLEKLGITSLRQRRHREIANYCKGRILDVGCGMNELAKIIPNVVGVDINYYPGVVVIDGADKLPFPDSCFDVVVLIASLNHLCNRENSLKEVFRVLTPNGMLLVTMLNPIIGFFIHKLAWWDQYPHSAKEKNIKNTDGLWKKDVIDLLVKAGFKNITSKKFIYGLNRLYIAKKSNF